MNINSEDAERMAALVEVLNRVIAHQRDYAVKLWEFGQALNELDQRGLPTVLGEEAALAKKMFRRSNSVQEIRNAMPIPKPLTGGAPSNEYYAKLEDWFGTGAVEKMKKVLAIIQTEVQRISGNVNLGNS